MKIIILSAVIFFAGLLILGFDSGYHSDEMDINQYGKNVLKYYTSMASDSSYKNVILPDGTKAMGSLQTYGTNFDFTYAIIDSLFSFDKDYLVRHIINQLLGAFTLLFTSLLVYKVSKSMAGAISAAILLGCTPVFFGLSVFDTKDIPFALGYIMSTYYSIKIYHNLPELNWKNVLKLSLAFFIIMGTRLGGGIVIINFGLLLLIGIISHPVIKKQRIGFIKKNIVKLICGIGAVFVALIIFTPALQTSNPIAAMMDIISFQSNFPQKIPFFFEGEKILSTNLPKHYLPTVLSKTLPEFIIFLAAILPLALVVMFRKKTTLWFLFFVVTFPIIYAYQKNMPLYNHWRHLIFIYPCLIAFMGSIIGLLEQKFNSGRTWIPIAICAIGMAQPALHILKNKDLSYFYFNPLSGGLEENFSQYENDYWQIGIKDAYDWLLENELKYGNNKDSISIATNGYSVLKDLAGNTKPLKFIRIGVTTKSQTAWDYAIFSSIFVPRYILEYEWPLYETIHTIDVEDKAVICIVKKENYDDMKAIQMIRQGNYEEGIALSDKYLKEDPANLFVAEIKANGLIQKHEYKACIELSNKALMSNPTYSNFYYLRGVSKANLGLYDAAIEDLNYAIKTKNKEKGCYTGLMQLYQKKGNLQAARQVQQMINQRFPK